MKADCRNPIFVRLMLNPVRVRVRVTVKVKVTVTVRVSASVRVKVKVRVRDHEGGLQEPNFREVDAEPW